ncbi:MAG: DUF4411 family protein [Fimbriimonadaceae bacterium]|nr:DUF4411 family protein [Fimbriimonadaceae bacterium]QYK55968.1 MAG: DUF4411 family protein [Fimbriimonadaceae bacterium]
MEAIFYWDANIIITLNEQFPSTIIPKIHELAESQVKTGRIRVCEHVFREMKGGVAKEWADQHKEKCFEPVTNETMKVIREVAAIPDFVDATKTESVDADHFLVATALAHHRNPNQDLFAGEAIVVTMEKRKKPEKQRLKVPDACDHLGVKCVDFYGWLNECGYKLDIVPKEG